MSHLVIAMLLLAQVGAAAPPGAYARYNRVTKFDHYFSKYSKRYFGVAFDWRHFKAQAIAESRLEPDARSRVGAVGLMQIMPKTFEEIRHKNPSIKGTRDQPRWSIAAGIWYDRQQFNLWIEPASAAGSDQVHVRLVQRGPDEYSPGSDRRRRPESQPQRLDLDRAQPAQRHRQPEP